MGWLTIFLYGLFALGALGMAWAATGAVLTVLTKCAHAMRCGLTPLNETDRGYFDTYTQI